MTWEDVNTIQEASVTKLTELMPTPSLTPNRRKNHQAPAPAIPAAPVPLAKYDTPVDGYRVDSCRNVSSPRPEENDAREIPSKRWPSEVDNATTYVEDKFPVSKMLDYKN
jgi:hypothetical protein